MGSVVQKYIIIKDRVEIYKDFTINLLNYIHKYYIDYESINSDEDISNHFNWCYTKVCDEFLLEGIDFKKNADLRKYFYSYYYAQFYTAQDSENHDVSLQYLEKFWKNIFEFNEQKNRNIVNILIEIYTVFDKSVDVEKNILEII